MKKFGLFLFAIASFALGQSTIRTSTLPQVGTSCSVSGQNIIYEIGINVLGTYQCQPGTLTIIQLSGSQSSSGGTPTGTSAPLATGFNTPTAWGDSLTCGLTACGTTTNDGSGISYPLALNFDINQTVYNEGIAGQTSTQIAVRQGGDTTVATVTGNSIPNSGNVAITFTSGAEPAFNAATSPGILGTLCGVKGYTLDNGSHVYSFTPSPYPASPIACSAGSPWTSVLGTMDNGLVLIWSGRNNFNSPSTVESDIAAMVSSLPASKNYLVLSVINAEGEGIGTTNYTAIASLNSTLSSTYGSHYYDIREALVGKYNSANPDDVLDHTKDIPSYSLRAPILAGTITSAITTTGQTTFSTSLALNSGGGDIITIGTEQILIISTSGTNVTNCTRGYAGTTAGTYSSSTAYTGVGYLHLNSAGYKYVASIASAYAEANPNPSTFVPLTSLYQMTGNVQTVQMGQLVNNATNALIANLNASGAFSFYESLQFSATNSFDIGLSNYTLSPRNIYAYNNIIASNQIQGATLNVGASGPTISKLGDGNFGFNKNLEFGTTNTFNLGNGSTADPANGYFDTAIRTPLLNTGTIYSAAGTALPTCNTSAKGERAVVSDATLPSYLGIYTSGGAVIAPVFCNGTNWLTD